MGTDSIDTLIEGGKCSAAPPLGPALGPLGVNIGEVVAKINEQTKMFAGMKVPVKVIVDADTKEFEIEIGTPPCSQLIKKEANIEKGSGNPLNDKVADILIEQCIKIAKMKETALLGANLKSKIKEVVGTCRSMGILVEGSSADEAIKRINEGEFDEKIKAEKTELSTEELKKLEAEKKKLAQEIEDRRAEFEKTAKAIIKQMEGKEKGEIKSKLKEENVPDAIIKELMPADEAAPSEGEKPADVAATAEEDKKEE